jgi:peptidoglycan hydrolase CwlO-like protein
MRITRPKTVIDVKNGRTSSFTSVPSRVDLASKPKKISLIPLVKGVLFGAVLLYALFGLAFAPNRLSSFAAEPTEEERAQLEKDLAGLEQQIADYEITVAAYKKQGVSLKGEISSLTAKMEKVNLQIKAINLSLAKLNRDIDQNKNKITTTQQKLDFNREAMMQALQSVYENENTSLVTILLTKPNLSDFFNDINNLVSVQESLTATAQKINELKNELLDEQDDLVSKKTDATNFKTLQDNQRKAAEALKREKDELLKTTKGQEAAYQKLVAEKRASAAKIRNRLFELLGGGEMTFEAAYNLAKTAEAATNVPAALLLAVLDRESALGKNVGRCSYKTAMAPGPPKSKRDDVTIFLKITSELGLDPEKTLVSCAISTDGAYGGAMGPAQFIPTTWMLYRDRIAAVTGNSPASPWKNGDAFVGTALYLKDAMSACTGAYASGNNQIKCAAARYYAGGS